MRENRILNNVDIIRQRDGWWLRIADESKEAYFNIGLPGEEVQQAINKWIENENCQDDDIRCDMVDGF